MEGKGAGRGGVMNSVNVISNCLPLGQLGQHSPDFVRGSVQFKTFGHFGLLTQVNFPFGLHVHGEQSGPNTSPETIIRS